MIKVSIIIPVYNVASYVEQCIGSCVGQTFGDIEIIVVNDGSTDSSPQLIERYAAKDERIVVINKTKNEGLIYARKSGIEIARGEYIVHLDGDDYISERAIELLYKEIVAQDADMVMGNSCRVLEGRTQSVHQYTVDPSLAGQDLLYELMHEAKWTVWDKIMRKSLYDEMAYCNLTMGEDLFQMMQLLLKVRKVAFVREYIYFQNVRSSSITGNKTATDRYPLYKDFIQALYRLLDLYPFKQKVREKVFFLIILMLEKHCVQQNSEWVRHAAWKELMRASNHKRLYKSGRKAYLRICVKICLLQISARLASLRLQGSRNK